AAVGCPPCVAGAHAASKPADATPSTPFRNVRRSWPFDMGMLLPAENAPELCARLSPPTRGVDYLVAPMLSLWGVMLGLEWLCCCIRSATSPSTRRWLAPRFISSK